ncbi:MAG: pyridoxamine 5'-phosphate oxidase family protein [Synergistaceae bacterium]|nr:pyridoxamine 5'-phosphate oxidase family protein [Synergistaceae bacterium]
MRRKDREVTDPQFIGKVLNNALHGNLGLCDNGEPYIVPMNFAWSDNKIWLHCATEGRKLDIIRANPKVCFQVSADAELKTAEEPCEYGMYYSSVVIFGTASIMERYEEKAAGLEKLMQHFSKDFSHKFTEDETRRVCVISIEPREITCKARVKNVNV